MAHTVLMEGDVSEREGSVCREVVMGLVGVLRCLKRGKDGILNEMMVYGGSRMVDSLLTLFNRTLAALLSGL